MPSLLLLADDLTGAADTGVAFASAGMSTVLVMGASGVSQRHERRDADVLCVDTDSRWRDPEAAAAAVREAVDAAGAAGHVYKKVDSTLRGNIAAEIDAALHATGSELAVLAPAFPATCRTTVHGRQLVDGRPLDVTGTWRELRAPDRVADLFAGSGPVVSQVELTDVRSGVEWLATLLRARAAGGGRVVVCDAETETDLGAIAAAGVRVAAGGPRTAGVPILWAGSGGLAPHLARALGLAVEKEGAAGSAGVDISAAAEGSRGCALPSGGGAGPLLAVVGSATEQCQAQTRALVEAGFIELRLPARTLLDGTDAELEALSVDVSRAVRDGDTVVTIADGDVIGERGTDPERAVRALGRVAARAPHPAGGLILTGGETARAVLAAAGVAALRLRGEIEPGVVLSQADDLAALPVVTKAGAFGDEGSLVRAARVLAVRG